MTDSSHECPLGLRTATRTTAPLRTCGRFGQGCATTSYPTYGIEYSRVCGRIIGYQFGYTYGFRAFYNNRNATIDSHYVDGVSLTHGRLPRKHIWTFANAFDEANSDQNTCPCTQPHIPYTGVVPPFIGQDYFCETGSRSHAQTVFYFEDPLWDGQGAGGTSTCCFFNNPPWFCKELPQPTTDNIELRLCGIHASNLGHTYLETVEVYIQ